MGAGRQSRGRGAFLKEAFGACEAKSGLHRAACRLTAGGAGLKARFTDQCHRKYTAGGSPDPQVRVKRCGKSAPRCG